MMCVPNDSDTVRHTSALIVWLHLTLTHPDFDCHYNMRGHIAKHTIWNYVSYPVEKYLSLLHVMCED